MTLDPFADIKLLGFKDVQNILGVSRSFIQKIINDKLLLAQKTSAGWIFPESAVLEFQEKRLQKSKTDKRIHL